MSTAPQDRPILILADGWSWDCMNMELDEDDEPEWRVCDWMDEDFGESGWATVTSNPYCDVPINPRGWVDLPPAPDRRGEG